MAIAVFALLVGVGLLVLLALGARRTHRARAKRRRPRRRLVDGGGHCRE